ncbi:MAG: dihydrodipicolinate synthase family protein, partial [Chloroflexota bacterium]
MAGLPERFGGIVPPVCTPMTEAGEVDVPSLRRLIEFLIEAGVHGLFFLGSTGETAFLTTEQRATVLEVATHPVAGRVPVVAGIIDMTTARALVHARVAEREGVDGLVLTAPFYTRTSPPEIIEHFRAIRAAVDLPILAYDIPVCVHTKLTRAMLIQMARESLIVGVKDSSGDEANFRGLVLDAQTFPNFSVFTGSELLVDTALFMGANGAVPGLGNVDPEGYLRLYRAARAGDWATARQEQERLYRLFSIIEVGVGRMG